MYSRNSNLFYIEQHIWDFIEVIIFMRLNFLKKIYWKNTDVSYFDEEYIIISFKILFSIYLNKFQDKFECVLRVLRLR